MGLAREGGAVLLLTHSQDHFTVDRVAGALRRRGARPFRLDTDRFPERVKLSAELGSSRAGHIIKYRGKVVSAAEVEAVWARRIWLPRLAKDLDPKFHDLCVNESLAAIEGFLDGLHSARWVNDPGRDREAENKLLQLRTALEVGLRVPRTLVTNDPQQLRRFYREVNGMMVAKLLRPVSMSMDGASSFVYTSEVTRSDLAEGNLLRHSPMVFQERIPKSCELRVAFVAGQLFVGAIDASGSSRGQVDWRRSSAAETRWERDQVPGDLANSVKALMTKLGLVYGAIDLIRTPEGEHVFLEVNPGGEWGMLERELEFPISEAIAGALLQ